MIMNNRFIALSLAAVALMGCNKYEKLNPDVPFNEREKIEVFGGSGNLVTFDGAETKSTYTWDASGSAINVIVNIDLEEYLTADNLKGGYELGHFTLPVSDINAFLGTFVGSELDESTFYGLKADGSKADKFTSYAPGMWVDVDGNPCSWSDGVTFWQWYVWSSTSYDYPMEDYPSILYIGANPGNTTAAVSGKTVACKNIIVVDGENYEFNVTVKFSTTEMEDPEDATPGSTEPAGEGFLYEQDYEMTETAHKYSYSVTSEGVTINAEVSMAYDTEVQDEAWVVGYFKLNSAMLKSIVGDVDLSDLEVFYPLNADGEKYTNADGETKWTTYAPGQWVDADGNGCGWDKGHIYWFYQNFANYEGYNAVDAFCIGINPGNVTVGETVTSKNMLNGIPFNVVVKIVE